MLIRDDGSVNNVGKSHDMPVYFHDTELQELKDIVQINVFGTLRVTQIVLPSLLARSVMLYLTSCPPQKLISLQKSSTGRMA